MGKTKIQWTSSKDGSPGYSFNPWWGCTKVSPGCANCYAERESKRFGHDVWGAGKPRRTFGDKHWAEPLAWDIEAAKSGVRKRVFCGSMCDWCDEEAPVGVVPRLFDLIERTPNLDWLLLTKRPERINQVVPPKYYYESNFPRNIWLGTTTENQAMFDARWPVLQGEAYNLKAALTFLSIEPMLGPVDISEALEEVNVGDEEHDHWLKPVDWVIVGGESGTHARIMHPAWARSVRDQCVRADIPYFFKQWGEYIPASYYGALWPAGAAWGVYGLDGKLVDQSIDAPEPAGAVTMLRVGKKAAGDMLDGRQWHQFPK